jgi:hypothetical protein
MYLIGYILVTLVANPGIDICIPNISDADSALNTTTLFHEQCAGPMLGALIIM